MVMAMYNTTDMKALFDRISQQLPNRRILESISPAEDSSEYIDGDSDPFIHDEADI